MWRTSMWRSCLTISIPNQQQLDSLIKGNDMQIPVQPGAFLKTDIQIMYNIQIYVLHRECVYMYTHYVCRVCVCGFDFISFDPSMSLNAIWLVWLVVFKPLPKNGMNREILQIQHQNQWGSRPTKTVCQFSKFIYLYR